MMTVGLSVARLSLADSIISSNSRENALAVPSSSNTRSIICWPVWLLSSTASYTALGKPPSITWSIGLEFTCF